MATKKQDSPQLSLPEIVAERKRLQDEQQAIEEKLNAVKADSFAVIQHGVDEFNATFGTHFSLAESKPAKGPRKCKVCKETGHTSKHCPHKPAPGYVPTVESMA